MVIVVFNSQTLRKYEPEAIAFTEKSITTDSAKIKIGRHRVKP